MFCQSHIKAATALPSKTPKQPRLLMTSWVSGADGSEFPIQNLPMGCFSHVQTGRDPRIGVAIGNMVLDMRALLIEGMLHSDEFEESVFKEATLNKFMGRPRAEWRALRARLTELLESNGADATLRSNPELQARCMVPLAEVTMCMPATIGDYTDFYASREHATNVGIMFRGKDNALQPNWLHLPVGYHGRASSVVVSGTPVVRPKGQLQLDKTDATKGTEHAPCRLLDFELEMGCFIGGDASSAWPLLRLHAIQLPILMPPIATLAGPPNPIGTPISMLDAEERIFGYVLCNDWSARDVQKFEYVPLGPFGAKNFCTSISPWVVMTDALTPFKCATSAGEQTDPVPLDYLRDPDYSSYDVCLSVAITPEGSDKPTVVSTSNFRHMYWTAKQQVVHHSVTGCNMRPGDLIASGTISGSDATAYGSLLELCWQGSKEVGPLADGSVRKFLKDGDVVSMRGLCQHSTGYKVGFGECTGKVLPANTVPPPMPPPPPMIVLKDVKLQSYWRSTCSWRVRIALAFFRVTYEYVSINLLEGDQVNVSPMHQVPRLDWLDGSGARQHLTQSLPIIELLNETYGLGMSLLPIDPMARARAREMAEIINSGIQPLHNLSHMREIQSDHPRNVIDSRAIAKKAIEKGLHAVEALAAKNNDSHYCVASHTSVADLCLIPQLYNARRFDVDLTPFKRLCAIEAHVSGLPYFKVAHPDAQPDAKP